MESLSREIIVRRLMNIGTATSGRYEKGSGEHPHAEGGHASVSATYVPKAPGEKKGTWVMADGTPCPPHVLALAKPAWTNVLFNPDPNADELVRGDDKAGRTVRMYNDRFNQMKQDMKFEKVKELDAKYDQVIDQNKSNMSRPETNENAEALHAIMVTGVRPGGTDTIAKVQSFGMTTLEGRHVIVNEKGDVTLSFTGKKGVQNDIPVNDAVAAKSLSTRATAAGKDGKLFPTITANGLRTYSKTLGDGGFNTKDFRTALGTRIAKEAVASRPRPTNDAEYKATVKYAAEQVSNQLGNDPATAIQYYIAPEIFAAVRP